MNGGEMDEFRKIPLDQIVESKTNPRRHFDKAALEQLAANIKERGVLVPLLLRPNPGSTSVSESLCDFELVAGARRFRAARMAGLDQVPARVLDLSDDAALEVQVIENLQREDVHELDEAQGYEALKARGYDVPTIAAKVGKDKSYIYKRMKLCALTKASRTAFFEGKVSSSIALLVARVPSDLQAKALDVIVENEMGFRQASDYLQDEFMLRLDEAPFPVSDAQLVPAAGSCGSCPKRTGNNPDLFGEIKSAEICTDPACFKLKVKTHAEKRLAEARAKGVEVLSDAAAKKVMPYGDDYVNPSAGLVRLDDACHEDPKGRTYRKLLKDVEPAFVKVLVKDGAVVELVDRKAVTAALKAAGHDFAKASNQARPVGASSHSVEEKRRTEKAARETRIRSLIARDIHDRAPATLVDVELLRAVAEGFVQEVWNENQKRLASINGWKDIADLKKGLKTADATALVSFLLTAAVVREVYVSTYEIAPRSSRLLAIARRLKIDPEKIRRDELAAATARKDARPPAKSAGARAVDRVLNAKKSKPPKKKPAGPLARKAKGKAAKGKKAA
jgi:ParB/RepB/Spo0J family partition protein